MTQYSICFIFDFKEHQKCVFKASRKIKMQIPFPEPGMVAQTTRTFIENNRDHRQSLEISQLESQRVVLSPRKN